jgi:hypothetical protein
MGVRLAVKILHESNTLAYSAAASVSEIKSFITLTQA